MADEAISEVVKEFHSRRRISVDGKTEHDRDAEKYYKYYGGEQWSKEDVEALKAQNRPALTLNQCLSVVNAVSGSEIVNRFESKFLPRMR
jgi:nuclear transport factor 2 (NTF2) superfamily protein